MPALITKEDFIKATKLPPSQLTASAFMKLTGIDRLNRLYDYLYAYKGLDFVHEFFRALEIKIKLDEKELAKIPKTGPFITISNHPFGAVDGLLLLEIIARVRPDYKVMANFLLQHIEPIQEHFLPVNPFESLKDKSSFDGIKRSLNQLNEGGGLGIFPAGEVSSFNPQEQRITDRAWQLPAIKIIKRANVPIVPIYFNGHNSLSFQILGLIHPSLRTVTLPSELFKKKGQQVRVRIGSPIAPKSQVEFENYGEFGRYLRAKTYSLGSALKVRRFYLSPPRLSKPKELEPDVPKKKLRKEIKAIEDKKVLSQSEFDLYLTKATLIPNIINQIGIQRELTFRAVGEGTNKASDLDEFDLYYQHLFLWDRENEAVAGAYRLGLGDEIMRDYGRKGFYSNTLFKYERGFDKFLHKSIELGRSFICEEYQQKRLPLFMLWQGIMDFTVNNPHYRYLVGPVSISGSYSAISRSLIVAFIKENYFDHKLSKLVKPRKRHRIRLNVVDAEALLNASKDDLKKVDQLIADIEPSHFTLPVLLKKYIRQNARIIGFNRDPKFNNALDGLIISDLRTLPEDMAAKLNQSLEQTKAR